MVLLLLCGRGATHSQVIQLLQASGPNPTLVVVSPPSTYAAPGYGTLPHSYVPENIAAEARRSVETFKEKVCNDIMYLVSEVIF